VETGGGGGSRLSEMPPPLSTRVCGELSGQGESFDEEERGGGGGLERECGRAWLWPVGFAWEADYKADERYSAREAMLLGVGAWAPIFLSLLLGPLFSLNFFVVSFIYSFLFSSFCSCLVLLRIRG